MRDPRDNRIHTDDDGLEWLIDEHGMYLRDEKDNKIAPSQSKPSTNESGFTTYDSSRGHCGMCGSISCNGGCFK